MPDGHEFQRPQVAGVVVATGVVVRVVGIGLQHTLGLQEFRGHTMLPGLSWICHRSGHEKPLHVRGGVVVGHGVVVRVVGMRLQHTFDVQRPPGQTTDPGRSSSCHPELQLKPVHVGGGVVVAVVVGMARQQTLALQLTPCWALPQSTEDCNAEPERQFGFTSPHVLGVGGTVPHGAEDVVTGR
jgi:hypothetical protein